MYYRFFKTLGIGVGSAVFIIKVFPKLARPALKSFIKCGLSLKNKCNEVYAENMEIVEDILAEVKEEMSENEN